MMPRGDGGFYLYLDGGLRKQTVMAVGDLVSVSVRFDPEYRSGPQHAMPPAFSRALEADPAGKARWDGLLGGANERFMARDWN